jgi:hypothetical protein
MTPHQGDGNKLEGVQENQHHLQQIDGGRSGQWRCVLARTEGTSEREAVVGSTTHQSGPHASEHNGRTAVRDMRRPEHQQ